MGGTSADTLTPGPLLSGCQPRSLGAWPQGAIKRRTKQLTRLLLACQPMRNPVELVKRLVLDQERSAFASLRFDFDPKTQSVRQLFFKGARIGILRGFGLARRSRGIAARQRFSLAHGKPEADDLVGEVGGRISGHQRPRVSGRQLSIFDIAAD